MRLSRERTFPATPVAASCARDFVEASLIAGLPPSCWHIADHAVLVTSELVTAAIDHGGDELTVGVAIGRRRVEIDVATAADTVPCLGVTRHEIVRALTTAYAGHSADGVAVLSAQLRYR